MPIPARAVRDQARQVAQNKAVGPGTQTMGGGTGRTEPWDDWTLFKITAVGTDTATATYSVGGYSGVEVSLDYSWHTPFSLLDPDRPAVIEVAGGRKADQRLNPIRSVLSGVVFDVNDLVQARPSRARPGEWEAIPFSGRRRNRVTIPIAYCDGEELRYYAICLEGDFEVISCDESSSSSSSGS